MTKKRKKVTLKDIDGIIKGEKIEGRFQEILSTQKIVDTRTGKEYDGMVDIEFLKWINDIDERFQNCRKEKAELRELNGLLWDIFDGIHAYWVLREKGYLE